ncbi:MAG: hypothetical protein R3A11_08145 [Bdellovibrionota bacterium]
MNEKISDRLISMHKKGRLHHAFLFLGLDAAAKRECMIDMASYLLSLEEKDVDRNLKVRSKIQSLSHPDFYLMENDPKEIKVEDVREFAKWAHRSPIETSVKVMAMPSAESLNTASSNALLKILEEPPSFLYMFLSSPNEASMLKTICSRCFSVQFPSNENIHKDLDSDVTWAKDLDRLMDLDQAVSSKDILQFAAQFSKDRQELAVFFYRVQDTIKKNMVDQQGSARFYHFERCYDQSLTLESEIYHRYGNIQLGLEQFLLSWRGLA